MTGYKHLIQRDAEISKLEQQVFEQIGQIYMQNCPKSEENSKQEIEFVSFEDALKELLKQKSL